MALHWESLRVEMTVQHLAAMKDGQKEQSWGRRMAELMALHWESSRVEMTVQHLAAMRDDQKEQSWGRRMAE